MKTLFASFLFLALTPFADAQNPKVVTGKAGELIIIDSSESKAEIIWRLDSRLRSPKSHYKDLANKRLVLVAPAGTFEILAIEKGGSEFLEWLVVVEGVGPAPPVPDPPTPIDSLAVKLKVAFSLDLATGKGTDKDKAKLVKVYTELQPYVDTTLIKTVYDARTVRQGTLTAIMSGQLPGTVKAIDDFLAIKIPEPSDDEAKKVDLVPATRARYRAAFVEIVVALGGEPAPVPDTPLVLSLKVAFSKEVAADKIKVADIVDACRKAVVKSGDQSLTTAKQVNDSFVADLKASVGQSCPNVRAAVTEYLNSKLPRTVTASLDQQTRANISSAFTDLVNGLVVLK